MTASLKYTRDQKLWAGMMYSRIHSSVVSARCGLQGCHNRARSVCWLEVVKGIPNQCILFCQL